MIREATVEDIREMMKVRISVKENILTDPSRVTDADNEEYLTKRGKGWVYELDGEIVGFAIVDLKDDNVWALFLHPEAEGKGIGKQLHHQMLNWYFSQGKEKIWLGTEPNTRASGFYRKMGWQQTGMLGEDEMKFELTSADWQQKRQGII